MSPTHNNFSSSDFTKFPAAPGVYLMKDTSGKIIYIGKAIHLRRRIRDYFTPGRDGRLMVPFLTRHVATIDTILVSSETEALLLENTLIKQHQPKYNALLKDDKTFPSLVINHTHPWPMIKVMRLKGRAPPSTLSFGPYPHAAAARQTLELLRTLFPLRQCSDHELKTRTRPCILYDLKRCVAPCCKRCTPSEYAALVDRVITFLKGEDHLIVPQLQKELQEASDALNFEQAGALYSLLQAVEATLEKQTIHQEKIANLDILAIVREGPCVLCVRQHYREGRLTASHTSHFPHVLEDNASLLTSWILQDYENAPQETTQLLLSEEPEQALLLSTLISLPFHVPQKGLKKELVERALLNARAALAHVAEDKTEAILLSLEDRLQLTHYPERIECIDQSHLNGEDVTGALVTFNEGEKSPRDCRTYHLRAQDDYAGLEEILRRRFRSPESLPDLLLIDGGLGHLHSAQRVLSELNISSVDIVAIAKEEGRHDRGLTQETLFSLHNSTPLHLPPHSPELFFLQKLRDETHRAALAAHTKRRHKRRLHSELDTLPGIGPLKKRRLLLQFGSIKQIKAAGPAAWKEVKGLTQKDIATLTQWVNKK